MIVCKFGGTSVAGFCSAKNIKDIVLKNANCQFVVVSALGKSETEEKKVTDCLFEIFYAYKLGLDYCDKLQNVFKRYENMAKKLKVDINFEKDKQLILSYLKHGVANKDFLVSRGEYLSAKLYAKFLGFTFLDAKDYIIFNKEGKINYKQTQTRFKKLPNQKKFVIGGYYGGDINGNIITFERGGSDITGAIIAKVLNAEVYENYTDVNGVFDKTPTLFTKAKSLPILNYKTAEFMADAGTEVVHKSAFKELKNSRVILMVKNTNIPNAAGTILVNSDFCFSNLFICVNKVLVIYLSDISNSFNKIKSWTHIEKIIKLNTGYFIICKQVYVPKNKFSKLKDIIQTSNCVKITMFSNIKITEFDLKIIKKIQKKVKNMALFCDFLAKDNNFVIICQEQFKNKIVAIINKHLQK
ncbi:MAG: hypothetical protein E7376_01550 [Clostridiales bacterium]|nr:hypothetical protein [Clostridiales bacterium]